MTSNLCRTLVVAIVGRTNAGKSTLINNLLHEHLCIVSSKTQTTRHLIQGIVSYRDCQIVITDTPGFQEKPRNQLNRLMNRCLAQALQTHDVLVWVLDVVALLKHPNTEMRAMAKILNHRKSNDPSHSALASITPTLIVLNKMDRLKQPDDIFPYLQQLAQLYPQAELMPLSALNGHNVDRLLDVLYSSSIEQSPLFPEDIITNRSEQFLASEILRECLYTYLRQELPFACTVCVDQFQNHSRTNGKPIAHIALTIVVSASSHKPIILGKRGLRLKKIATEARQQMEVLFQRQVFLKTWVKVIEGWQDDSAKLKELGYVVTA